MDRIFSSCRLTDAADVDARNVEPLPDAIGGEYRTSLEMAGRKGGTVAQPEPLSPGDRTESGAQQRGFTRERQDVDTQGLEDKPDFGLGPAVLVKTGRHLGDVDGRHGRAGP